MDIYTYLMFTLFCLSPTFAGCPNKCTCTKDESYIGLSLIIHCDDLDHIPLEAITSDIFNVLFTTNNMAVLPSIGEQEQNITQLKYLELSRNNISEIEVNSLRVFTSLSYLDLSFNNIRNIPNELLKTLINLNRLILRNNSNLILPENGFGTKALRYLHIDHCNLKEIPLKFFDTMPNITYLFLEGNHISYLGSHHVRSFQKMSHVDLERNNLTVLYPKLLPLLQDPGIRFKLDENPFRCDCTFKRIPSYIPCVVPTESNSHSSWVEQEEFLNSLDCETKTVSTNTSTSVSDSNIKLNVLGNNNKTSHTN